MTRPGIPTGGRAAENDDDLPPARHSRLSLLLLTIILLSLPDPRTEAKEAVIFEQIGQMSGVTAYLHVHVELSISSVEAQLNKYYTLLKQHFNQHEDAMAYMTKYLSSNYTYEQKHSIFDGRPELLPNGSVIRNSIGQWVKVARLHLKDVEDMKQHLGMLRTALPVIPNKVRAKSRKTFRKMPATADTVYAETYDGPAEFASTKTDLEEEDAYHVVEAVPLVQTTSRPPRSATTSGATPPNSRGQWYGVADEGFFTGPLTATDLDGMTVVKPRERREVLGAIALPLAIAATAMGAFNLAQIEALKSELFELKENTGRLFEVIQDFSKNMRAIEDSFNELRSSLLMSIMFNPVLFDARLSRLENQIRHRLQRVGHAIQAALHHRFAMDYLNPKELVTLFSKLQKRADEAGCELLINYHSDLFQVEASLLFDGLDGHILIHVPMTPKDSLLRLFRLHPFPLPLFDTHHLMPDVKQDVIGISSTDDKYNIQLSTTDLLSCHRVNQVFMCDTFGVMSKIFNDTCLGALYMQKFKEAQNLCTFKVVPVEEHIYQLKKGRFIVYLPQATPVHLKCRDKTHSELHMNPGTQQLVIPPGCQGTFGRHLVTSDYSVRLDSEVIHYEWEWDPITFLEPGEFAEMSTVVHHLKELKLRHPALSDLQYFAQLNTTRQWHGQSIGFLGLGLSSIGGILVAVAVVTTLIILYCKCCRKQGSAGSAASPGTTNIIQAAAPILPAPTQYQNPGLAISGQPQPTPRRAGTLPPAYEDDLCNPRTCRRHDHGTGWDDGSWGGRRPVRRSPRLQGRYSCLSGGDSGDDLDASYHRGRDEVQFPGSASGGRYKATAPARDSKSPPTPEELQERLSNIVR